MKPLLNFILYLYLFLPTSTVSENPVELRTNTKLDRYDASSITSEAATLTVQEGEKGINQTVLLKMLVIATNNNGCDCTGSKQTQISTTEKISKTLLGFKILMRNKPEKYAGNNSISRLCPYYVPNEGFKMYKMAAVYWAKFYNLKYELSCFKIHVLRLSAKQMKMNELKYGNFGGKVDWKQCHFEIKPPELFLRRRHFLMGGINDNGVMRNIMILYNSNGRFTLEEEAPDQWLMLRNLVVLRDCSTGEVVVYTRSLQQTTTDGIVQALRKIGEEMVGKMLCEDDDDWLDKAFYRNGY